MTSHGPEIVGAIILGAITLSIIIAAIGAIAATIANR